MKKILSSKEYVKSAMFGLNDALVSTTGVIAGVSFGTSQKQVVVLAGVVTILVEALSMGVGEYMSAHTADQLDKPSVNRKSAIKSGVVMWASYTLGGLVPLITIILSPIQTGRYLAIAAALAGLFALGYYKAKFVGVNPIKSALEVFLLGGATTLIGVIAGVVLKV
jgi:VIT1/CCC1 family predicted Fe2+/Mn2+ transporter